VASEAAVDTGPEYRVFDESEVGRIRAAPLKLVVKTDIDVRPEHGAQWRMLAELHRKTLHHHEWRLVRIGGEIKRIRECAGLPQHVVEEAELLAKRFLKHMSRLPPDAVAAAVLWAAAKAAGVPRPLADFLGCSKADERLVRRAVWRLSEVARLRRPSVEDYVKTLAARLDLPASLVKNAIEILEKNRRLLMGKNPWVWAAAALWLAAKFERFCLFLSILAEAAGATPEGVEKAAKMMRND
jgi:transcription initiation factor TFIIIB Brf1 subunit/transcription initiation factor TFIIB